MHTCTVKHGLAYAAFMLSFLCAQSSYASFTLMLDDLNDASSPVFINDAATNDLNTEAGVITFSGAIGAFNVNVTTGISQPFYDMAGLDLNSIDVNGKSPGTLRVGITDTGFTGNFNQLLASLGGTTQGSVKFSFMFDTANTPWSGVTFATKTVSATGSSTSFSDDISQWVWADTPYSLTILADITHTSKFQTTSFDASILPSEVPLPASILFYMSSIISLFLYGRKKRV